MRQTAYLVLAVLAFRHGDACAYIDPNAGGWLFQLLFPLLIALAGAWAVLRQKIAQILSNFARKLRGK